MARKGEKMKVTTGIPQGSVLSSTFWNVLYDGVLIIPSAVGAAPTRFADGVTIVMKTLY